MELIIKVLRFLTNGVTDSRQFGIRLAGLIALVVIVWLAVRLTQDTGAPPPLPQQTLPEQGDISVMGTLEMGAAVSGTLGESERHGWTFTGERGQVIDLRISGDWDSTLELIPPGSDTAIAIDFGSGGGTTPLLCAQRLIADGEYTAVVSGYLGLPDRDSGDYELSLTTRPASEPMPVAYGDTVSDRVETCDGDFYLIEVEQGDTLEVMLTQDGDTNLFARLLTSDSARELLASSRSATDDAGRTIDVLSVDVNANAQLLINVSASLDQIPADYQMSVTRP